MSYIVDGDSTSRPTILYFHGMLGKASDFIANEAPTTRTAIYLDRPGYGESSSVPSIQKWSYHDFNHLNVQHFLYWVTVLVVLVPWHVVDMMSCLVVCLELHP